MNSQAKKALVIWVAISTVVILVFYFSLLNIWQERIFDKFFITGNVPKDIVIFSIDNESISEIGQWPWSRNIFSKAIGKLQNSKVIAIDVNFSEPSRYGKADDDSLASAISGSKPKVILPVQVNTATGEKLKPLLIFQYGSIQALVNILIEDGVVRKIENYDGELVGFGAVAAQQFRENLSIPSRMRIDYTGPAKTYLTLSINDLLEDKIPERIYKDKIVMIGATAPDLHDFFQTPTGFLPGVEIHANAVNTLLGQNFYYDLPVWVSILLILSVGFISGLIIFRIKKFFWIITSLAAFLVGINLVAGILFSWKIITPVLYLNVDIIMVSIVLILFQYFSESKEKKFIYDSFKYYLAPDVINELISDPGKLKLGGELKRVSILFSDIRGFTSIAEAMTPEQLTHVLNEYLTEMTDIVMEHRGLVDKYIGDAVMAFWGAPIPNPNQSMDSCRTAIRMIKALNKLNEHWKSANVSHAIKIGVGINTGEVIVGNFGSKSRFNYTILGDEVNLASRLESLNKAYGTEIIISESVKLEIESDPNITTRELDLITVKGKKKPVLIFEVIVNSLSPQVLEHFGRGREFYNQGKWDEAIKEFSFVTDLDGPSNLYIERCLELKSNPPLLWNGIYEFKTK